MKHELRQENRLSTNIHADASAAKIAMESLIQISQFCSSRKLAVKGYIHELAQNPYGFLLMSQLQVSTSVIFIRFRLFFHKKDCSAFRIFYSYTFS